MLFEKRKIRQFDLKTENFSEFLACVWPAFSLCLLLTLSLLTGCSSGGGDDDEEEDNGIALSGTILVPGGTVSNDNPIGLTGAANRSVSLYRIDDEGNIVGDVLDSTTSDADGNYVLLLPSNVTYSSDLIVEAQLENNETARAIVIDATTDITPITDYITQKLIDDPDLDLSALPVEEVDQLVEFVESLPLGPQPDLSSMLVEIAAFSDIVVEAEINDLASGTPQIRLSGLLSVPTSTSPRPASSDTSDSSLGLRPIPNATVELFRIDNEGNTIGPPIAVTVTNPNGVFTILLPVDDFLSGDKMLRSVVDGQDVIALVTDEQIIMDSIAMYVANRLIQEDNFDLGGVPVEKLDEIDQSIRQLGIDEEADLPSTLATIDAVAGATVSAEINQIIVEENDSAPVIGAAGPFDLLENSPVATAIATVTASDSDPVGAVIGFSIVAGNAGGGFAIDNNGNITVADSAALDRETTANFTLTITATDGTNTSAGREVVINLLDVNDNAPSITAGQTLAVNENAANTDLVGIVAANDPDTGGIASFSITGGNIGNVFAIDAVGAITVANAGALDRETISSYTLTVVASDNVNPDASATVSVNINDINDNAPVVDTVGPFNVNEDAANATVVGTVTATDADSGGVTGFSITNGNTGNAFIIDAAGVITVADSTAIDFENANSFGLTVTANDGVNTSAGQPVTIDVNDVNDTAPVVNASGSPFLVTENSANGTAVGSVSATDADSVGAVASFSIDAGNASGAFAIDASGAITVSNTAALDRETIPSFTLTITAADDAGNRSAGADVVVDLGDLNDTAPVVTPGQSLTVAPTATVGTPVGTVIATDADTTGAITGFSITAGNTGGTFAISPAGQVTVADNTSLLGGSPYALTIEATDGTNTSIGETVTISVTTGSGGAVWDNFNWDDGSTWQ
jgi:hypothetical protein